MTDPKICEVCKGEGWVCECHPLTAWGNGRNCCGAAGMPCTCNRAGNPPPDMQIIWTAKDGYAN
jgi:hypothetical protein